MSCKEGIIAGIIFHVVTSDRPQYRLWRIVLTDDVPAVYTEWGNPEHFFSWHPESCREAQAIETYFVQGKGMIGGMTGVLDCDRATSVCVFSFADAPTLPKLQAPTHSREQRSPAIGSSNP